MEDALGETSSRDNNRVQKTVLILVLMEDALGVKIGEDIEVSLNVLILVLMEDALGV